MAEWIVSGQTVGHWRRSLPQRSARHCPVGATGVRRDGEAVRAWQEPSREHGRRRGSFRSAQIRRPSGRVDGEISEQPSVEPDRRPKVVRAAQRTHGPATISLRLPEDPRSVQPTDGPLGYGFLSLLSPCRTLHVCSGRRDGRRVAADAIRAAPRGARAVRCWQWPSPKCRRPSSP